MKPNTPPSHASRRQFLSQSSKIGLLCGFGCLCPHAGLELRGETGANGHIPDPRKLNYCGYTCPETCQMKLAGQSGDIEKKRAAYEAWDLKGRYGLEFDPAKILCNGCKTEARDLGMAVSHCPVRKCVIEKERDCCIECDSLATCDKALWKKFPGFHEKVIGLQKAYQGAQG